MHRRRTPLLAAAIALLAGCQAHDDARPAAATPTAPASAPSAAAPATVQVTSLARGRQPWSEPLTVRVHGAQVVDARAVDAAGRPVAGQVTASGWTSTAPRLVPATDYTVTLQLRSGSTTSTRTVRATTTDATSRLRPTFTMGDSAVVGVGQPIVVRFRLDVPAAQRAAVARRLVVTAPQLHGVAFWLSAGELHWRPASFWPAHRKVHVRLDLSDVYLGHGLWGDKPHTLDFATGAAHISTVDLGKHRMTVRSDGRVLRTFKISGGRSKYPTHAGTHLALEKEAEVTMDSATVGIPRNSPDGYYERVKWDVRISYSGEFVHAAPWSASAQGSANVSHGCVNLSLSDAEWFYEFARRGDVIHVIHGGQPPDLDDPGTADWNRSPSPWH